MTADELLDRVRGGCPRTGRRGPDPRSPTVVRARVSQSLLEPPAARQGPGPLPQPLIEAIDVAVNRLVARTLPGDRRAAGVGVGTELAQLRPYEVGDDVRHIDPAATRPDRPATRAPARARARADDLDRARRLAVDGVRHRPAAEGGRRRGRGARVRASRDPARGQRRDGGVRGRRRRACCRRAAPSPGWWRSGGCWQQGVAPDGAADPGALAGALCGARPARKQPGLGRDHPTFATSTAGSGRSGRCGCATPCSRSRCSTRASASCRPSGRLALVDPETGERVEVNTSRRRVRERFAELERERRDEGGARAAPAARRARGAVRPAKTGCSSWGDACDELLLAAVAARLALIPLALLGDGRERGAGRRRYAVRFTGGVDAAAGGRPACRRGAASAGGVCAGGDRRARGRARAAARVTTARRSNEASIDARDRPFRLDGRHRRVPDAACRPPSAPRTRSSTSCRGARSVGAIGFGDLAGRRAGAVRQPRARRGRSIDGQSANGVNRHRRRARARHCSCSGRGSRSIRPRRSCCFPTALQTPASM